VARENQDGEANQAHRGRGETQRVTADHPGAVIIEMTLPRADKGKRSCRQPNNREYRESNLYQKELGG
jgi:hypothetical protein